MSLNKLLHSGKQSKINRLFMPDKLHGQFKSKTHVDLHMEDNKATITEHYTNIPVI